MRIRFWKAPALPDARRQALEEWARMRLQMLHGDPMTAIIGAVGRLTGEGIGPEAAMDMVIEILHGEDQRVS